MGQGVRNITIGAMVVAFMHLRLIAHRPWKIRRGGAQRALKRRILFRSDIDRIMKHHIQISGRQGFRILPGKMIPYGVAHKTRANPGASGTMCSEHRKAAHHARVTRNEIRDIGSVAHPPIQTPAPLRPPLPASAHPQSHPSALAANGAEMP